MERIRETVTMPINKKCGKPKFSKKCVKSQQNIHVLCGIRKQSVFRVDHRVGLEETNRRRCSNSYGMYRI